MTAITAYNVQEEKDRIENIVQGEREQPEASLQERIDEVVLDLYVLCGSLGTVGELMLNAEGKCDSVGVGEIIDHYTGLISDGLGRIEECLTSSCREERI